jgi:hypothetical protein
MEQGNEMRLILSRKGFDSGAGGCPSPIFPDGSMIALPIPDKLSPIRYRELKWRGRNLGDVVAELTRGKQRRDYRTHLDPDLRKDICRRQSGWLPTLGQHRAAQGHLRNQGVGVGDLFLFWALFRAVDDELKWSGRREHYVWGWFQVGAVAPVDEVVRRGGKEWQWARKHPHLAFPPDQTNTLYVASKRLSLPGERRTPMPGSGVFDFVDSVRRLTAPESKKPSEWSLPGGFLPKGRPPLSYHRSPDRWSKRGDRVHLRCVAKGQEFVLNLDLYSELNDWLMKIIS